MTHDNACCDDNVGTIANILEFLRHSVDYMTLFDLPQRAMRPAGGENDSGKDSDDHGKNVEDEPTLGQNG
jgi:hypothetical protein